MKSKFKLYDRVKDFASEYEGTITAIQLRAEGFIYSITNNSSNGQLPSIGDFPEPRLELVSKTKNKIGFYFDVD